MRLCRTGCKILELTFFRTLAVTMRLHRDLSRYLGSRLQNNTAFQSAVFQSASTPHLDTRALQNLGYEARDAGFSALPSAPLPPQQELSDLSGPAKARPLRRCFTKLVTRSRHVNLLLLPPGAEKEGVGGTSSHTRAKSENPDTKIIRSFPLGRSSNGLTECRQIRRPLAVV